MSGLNFGLNHIAGPAAADHAVILLHGILQTSQNLADPLGLELSKLAGNGVSIYAYGYDYNQHLLTNGFELADKLEKLKAIKIDLVGYSMGGLVARLAASDRINSRLRRIVTIATPNRGALGPVQLTMLGQITMRSLNVFTALAPRADGICDLTKADAIMRRRRARLKDEYPKAPNPVSKLAYASIPALFYNRNKNDFTLGPSVPLSIMHILSQIFPPKFRLINLEKSHDGIVTESSCKITITGSHDWSEVHLADIDPNGEPTLCHAVWDRAIDHDHSSIIKEGSQDCARLIWVLLSAASWKSLSSDPQLEGWARIEPS